MNVNECHPHDSSERYGRLQEVIQAGYHLLNLTHLAAGKNRFEIRAFVGTLNKTKVVGYLMMVLGLAELTMNTKRCADWDYNKKDGTKRCRDRPGAGLGETELNRLFYRLGWTKGW